MDEIQYTPYLLDQVLFNLCGLCSAMVADTKMHTSFHYPKVAA